MDLNDLITTLLKQDNIPKLKLSLLMKHNTYLHYNGKVDILKTKTEHLFVIDT